MTDLVKLRETVARLQQATNKSIRQKGVLILAFIDLKMQSK
jgi:hypothetical protein